MSQELEASIGRIDTSRENPQEQGSSDTLLNVLWRRAGWLIVGALVGLGVGYWQFTKKQKQYSASGQILVESSKAMTITETGASFSDLPPADIMVSILTGKDLLTRAAAKPSVKGMPRFADASLAEISGTIRGGLSVQPQGNGRQATNAIVLNLSFNSNDPQLCTNAIEAVTAAFEDYLSDRQKNSYGELTNLVASARDKLLPEINDLESQYQEFRSSAPLEWDRSGDAINPHRVMQASLQTQIEELNAQKRDLNRKLRSLRGLWTKNRDPAMVLRLALPILQDSSSIQSMGEDPMLESLATQASATTTQFSDQRLSELKVEEELVPLLTQRDVMVTTLGSKHPAVDAISKQIQSLRDLKSDLVAQRLEREKQLAEISSSDSDVIDEDAEREAFLEAENERSKKLLADYVLMLNEQIRILDDDLASVGKRIDEERSKAMELSKFESDDAMYQRQLVRLQNLFDQLDDKIASLSINDEQSRWRLTRLMMSSSAWLVGPKLESDLAYAGILGLLFGGGLAFLIDRAEKAFYSGDEITSALGLPILAYVPLDDGKLKEKRNVEYPYKDYDDLLGVVHKPEGMIAEAVRSIRTRMFFDLQDDEKVIMVTSASAGDGKSTIAGNLACSIAKAGRSVILVDCDIRNPQVGKRFGLGEGSKGIVNVLNGDATPDEVIVESRIKHLDLMSCGPLPSNPAEALSLPDFEELISWLRERYEYVVVDTPPVLAVADTAIVAEHVDRIIMTLRIRRRSRPLAQEALRTLQSMNREVMGLVVNAYDEAQLTVNYSYETQKYYGPRSEYRKAYRKAGAKGLVEVVGRERGDDRKRTAKPVVTIAEGRTSSESTTGSSN